MDEEENDVPVRNDGRVTIPMMYSLPDGSEALVWATVSEDVKPETLDALRRRHPQAGGQSQRSRPAPVRRLGRAAGDSEPTGGTNT